jgi:hypothetical protein
MDGRANVIADVQVVHIEQEGRELVADLIGSSEPVVMAEVMVRSADDREHREVVAMFERWEGAATPLTLVEGEDGVVTLVDAEAPFRAA